MATQQAALIAKQVANPRSERLTSAYATVDRGATRNSAHVIIEIEDAPFLSVTAFRTCGT
jgi:hypothetical protein